MLMLLLGADEAGKGPVIGSMFVAGLVIEEEKLFDLAGFGVKDSKQLAPAKREVLARKIREIADDIFILEVKPQMIDELRVVMTMNEIMVRSFAEVVRRLHADRAVLDAADVDASRFRERVKSESKTAMDLIAEHKADERHLVVSAASILAKVRRDASMRELEAQLECKIGSGYPHDQDTIAFLSNWAAEKKELPACARHSWATAQRIKASFI
ncbi:Ribonuclease HII [uncultured archaeon]|nr:Ribonuclease HII [uncultured archaeon]